MHVSAPPATLSIASHVSRSHCSSQFSVGFDTGAGAPDVWSRNKMRLVLRNIGPEECSLLALPDIIFKDRFGKILDVERVNPFRKPNLGHGPQIHRVTISAGGTATATISWQNAHSVRARCVATASSDIALDDRHYPVDVAIEICGSLGSPIEFLQRDLTVDP